MRVIATLAGLLLSAASAAAQDQQVGARTKAMGGSYTAFEDDPVSIWLNPAGIATQPDQASISYQTYTAYPVSRERGPNDTILFSEEAKTVMADPEIVPSFLGFVTQLGSADSPIALGFCYVRPYHLRYAMDEIVSPTQTSFQPDNEVEQSISRFRVALAMDFPLRRGEAGFFTHVAVGIGLDVGYERWRFRSPSGDSTDTSAALGAGAGVLVGLYDNTESFRVNLGLAYQSPVNFRFSVSPGLQPAFDMPGQLNVGATFYLLKGFPLRLTFDAQSIEWRDTAARPFFDNQPRFENVVNFSAGVEYRISVSEKVSLYPRLGYRRFDAPWGNANDLPATGGYKLVLDTRGQVFDIVAFGVGVSWVTAEGKVRSVDLAGDVGGDAPNVSLGYTHEF